MTAERSKAESGASLAEAVRPLGRSEGHWPRSKDVAAWTDHYFRRTAAAVRHFGDVEATYAVFLRRRVIAALEPAIRLIKRLVPEAEITRFFEEGDIVPSETKLLSVRGPFSKLSEVETLLLQKVGLPCVCANNAYEMCRAMPGASFLDMHARRIRATVARWQRQEHHAPDLGRQASWTEKRR